MLGIRKPNLIEGFQGLAFGLMDGIITILGVVLGVAAATESSTIAIIAGTVAGVSNAFGNAVGFYASELAERGEHIRENQQVSSMAETNRSTLFTFLASLLAMLVPVIPFTILQISQAIIASSLTAIAILFMLGYYVGRFNGKNAKRFGARYVLMGAVGALFAYLLGDLLRDIMTFGRWIIP